MGKTDIKDIRAKIGHELEQISRYVSGFEIHSAKDEQAIAEILNMLAGVNAAIAKIEEAHQRRIHLTKELSKALQEMEHDSRRFAENH